MMNEPAFCRAQQDGPASVDAQGEWRIETGLQHGPADFHRSGLKSFKDDKPIPLSIRDNPCLNFSAHFVSC
jgi:hypothetical protein